MSKIVANFKHIVQECDNGRLAFSGCAQSRFINALLPSDGLKSDACIPIKVDFNTKVSFRNISFSIRGKWFNFLFCIYNILELLQHERISDLEIYSQKSDSSIFELVILALPV